MQCLHSEVNPQPPPSPSYHHQPPPNHHLTIATGVLTSVLPESAANEDWNVEAATMWNALTGISVIIVTSTIVIFAIFTILTILIFLTLLLHRQEWSSRLSSSSQEMMAMNSLERQSATVSVTIIYIVKSDIDSDHL